MGMQVKSSVYLIIFQMSERDQSKLRFCKRSLSALVCVLHLTNTLWHRQRVFDVPLRTGNGGRGRLQRGNHR